MKKLLILALLALSFAACNRDPERFADTKICPGCNLTNAYFKDKDFSGANLAKANLLGATITESVLKGANFEDAVLFNTNLMNSDLSGANLKNVLAVTANFRNANLEGADLTGADFSGAIWIQGFRCHKGSIGVCFKTALDKLTATNDCEDCNLFRSDLSGRTFENTNFHRANLTEANLRGTVFKNVNLRTAVFKNATI